MLLCHALLQLLLPRLQAQMQRPCAPLQQPCSLESSAAPLHPESQGEQSPLQTQVCSGRCCHKPLKLPSACLLLPAAVQAAHHAGSEQRWKQRGWKR